MRRYFYFFVFTLFFSCDFFFTKHHSLIRWEKEYVMEDSEEATPYYTNREDFIKPYFSVNYLKDTIIATTLMEINACGKTEGNIKISNDTIILMTEHTSLSGCNSVIFVKCRYWIRNLKNKKYIIVSER